MTAPIVEVLLDPDALARRVADWLLDLALTKEGAFSLCLSGGSTPKTLYHLLAETPYRDSFPWARTHLFWGDERFVAHDDDLSNYKMVKDALLDHAPIPEENIHPVPFDDLTPEGAAAEYERELKGFYGQGDLDPAQPFFDVNLLGLGPDGHTASLFPGTEVLKERNRWVAPVVGAKAEARITLTYPALDSARHVAFLVAGAEKAEMLARLCRGDDTIPAAHVHPTGELRGFQRRRRAESSMTDQALYPLSFEPIFQYRLWGGRKLGDWIEKGPPGWSDRRSLDSQRPQGSRQYGDGGSPKRLNPHRPDGHLQGRDPRRPRGTGLTVSRCF